MNFSTHLLMPVSTSDALIAIYRRWLSVVEIERSQLQARQFDKLDASGISKEKFMQEILELESAQATKISRSQELMALIHRVADLERQNMDLLAVLRKEIGIQIRDLDRRKNMIDQVRRKYEVGDENAPREHQGEA